MLTRNILEREFWILLFILDKLTYPKATKGGKWILQVTGQGQGKGQPRQAQGQEHRRDKTLMASFKKVIKKRVQS